MLYDRIQADMISAMKAKEKVRLIALRAIMNIAKNHAIDRQTELTDQTMVRLIQKLIKQSEESKIDYQKAGRTEQVEHETLCITIMKSYLPEAPSKESVKQAIDAFLSDFEDVRSLPFGQLVQGMKPKLPEHTDMGMATKMLRSILDQKHT